MQVSNSADCAKIRRITKQNAQMQWTGCGATDFSLEFCLKNKRKQSQNRPNLRIIREGCRAGRFWLCLFCRKRRPGAAQRPHSRTVFGCGAPAFAYFLDRLVVGGGVQRAFTQKGEGEGQVPHGGE